jgi:hypothetical protein
MKPLPDLDNEAAMLKRGRLSVIASARKDAAETLRDAYTLMQSNDWADLATHARVARDAADRLVTLAAMWDEVA